jgi:streptogramin lyase
MSWSALPGKDGLVWIPEYGPANKIAQLDPATGAISEYQVPNPRSASIHSVVPAPDGTVWLTEQGAGRLGKWDPATKTISEYQDSWGKHTIRITPDGMVWSTGGLTRYDPKTGTFTHIAEVPSVYGIALDPENNIWFAENIKDGKIGKVDAKTLKVTKYYTPTTQRPRRIQVDSDGTVWFAGLDLGMIARFDPRGETFKEYKLPGPRATPYALGIDTEHKIWYSSESQDVLGRLDPQTGKVTEYPMPFAENGMRDFFLDAQGQIWFGSPPNNKVGYFYLAE